MTHPTTKYSLANTLFFLFAKNPLQKTPRKCPTRNFPAGKARFDFDISNRMKQAIRMAKPPLGRGLGALLGGGSPAVSEKTPAPAERIPPSPLKPAATNAAADELRMDQIHPCPFQPRKEFDEASLKELAESIQSQGIVQPLIVRAGGGRFEIIAGERRWRAAQLAGLKTIPAVIRKADDREVMELALVENLQRENLNPIEEAAGLRQLIQQFDLRQDEAAQKVGKSRAAIANTLRLLKLPAKIQTYLRDKKISTGHAKVLLGLSDAEQQQTIAEQVVKSQLSVRATETLIAQSQTNRNVAAPPISPAEPKNPNITRLEEKIRQRVGTRVHLRYQQGKGSLNLTFFSDEDLERIVQILGVEPD